MQYPYRSFNTLSNWVIGFAWLFGLAGAIGGLVLATQTVETYSGGFYGGYTESYPFVWLGIAVIVAAIAQAVFMTWMAYLGKVVIANGNGFASVDGPQPTAEPVGPPVEQIQQPETMRGVMSPR